MSAISTWQSAFEMPRIAMILGYLVPIAGFICAAWYKARKARSDNELKHVFVQRGLSADEIERFFAVGRPD